MSRARCRCAMPVKCLFACRGDSVAVLKTANRRIPATRIDQVTSDVLRLTSPTRREREQVHTTRACLTSSWTACFCKACELENTGNPFRSSDLGVMSPARCRCAMPVFRLRVLEFIQCRGGLGFVHTER
jgi:hypothetical protein